MQAKFWCDKRWSSNGIRYYGRLEDLFCSSTTCEGSCISVTIRNLWDDGTEVADPPPIRVFSGPMACTMPAPSGLVFRTASGSSAPNGGWSDAARYTWYCDWGVSPAAAISIRSSKPSEFTAADAYACGSAGAAVCSCRCAVFPASPKGTRFSAPLPLGTALGTYTKA